MVARRLAYTRKELSKLLGRSERTLVRWHAEGKFFHPWRDPVDPFKRWRYDVEEVDAFRRRFGKRGSGSYRIEPERQEAPSPGPSLPGPIAARVYARIKRNESIEDICEAEAVAPEEVLRLMQLRKEFESEREQLPRQPSEPRIVMDESDPDIAAIAKELEEERTRRRAETKDDRERGGSEEGAPPSRRRNG